MDNKDIIVIVIIAVTAMFIVDRCNKTQIEIAKEKANTTRDFNFGIGKKSP